MAIIKIRNAAIDLDAAEIPNIDASKITTGTFDASKIGSGTFADARIAASNVSQHATSFDDNKIVNDISTLAIRQASNENKGAYNTNSMYVDVFQDSTGITGLTNTTRNDNEYISSVTSSYNGSEVTLVNSSTNSASTVAGGTFTTNLVGANNWSMIDDATHTNYTGHYNTGGARVASTLWGIFGNSGHGSQGAAYNYFGNFTASSSADVFYAWDTGTTRADFYVTRYEYDRIWTSGTPSLRIQGSNDLTGSWTNIHNDTMDTSQQQDSGTFSNTTNYRYYRLQIHGLSGTTDVGLRELILKGQYVQEVASATGSFTSNNITASSSTNKMGAIITYQNQAGTNTLNTDIVLKLSADGGSNYSTATLVAMPDFSSGIKMAKVNDLSVTAGTSLKYKIEFANQASGSKEARIRGVSLQY